MFKRVLVGAVLAGCVASVSFGEEMVPAAPALPTIPAKAFSITDNGAVSNATALNTAAIQKTLDACAKEGGGTATIPAGTFVSGPLKIGSNTELHLEKGAFLTLSPNHADIPQKGGRYGNLLTAAGAHDISITGEGTIDGNGAPWWKEYARLPKAAAATRPTPQTRRPALISFAGCTKVLIKDVTLSNSPSMHIIFGGENMTVDHVHFVSPEDTPNTDGVAITGRNVLIENSTLDVGEDNIAIRPTGDASGDKANCQDIVITDSAFLHGKGISVGSNTLGGLKNLIIKNCTFDGTQNGIRLRSARATGGSVDGMTVTHVTMKNVKTPLIISSFYPTVPANAAADAAQPMTNGTPIWKNIHITDLSADGDLAAGYIVGLAEAPVTDVTLTNVHLTSGSKGLEITHAKGIKFENSTVSAQKGPSVVATDAEVTGIEVNKASAADNLP